MSKQNTDFDGFPSVGTSGSSSKDLGEDHPVVPVIASVVDNSQECIISFSESMSGSVDEASTREASVNSGVGEPISNLKPLDCDAEQGNDDKSMESTDLARTTVSELIDEGKSELAVASLRKSGEDIEFTLKTLLFGTLRRSFRLQIAQLLEVLGYLGQEERKVLEILSRIERVYPGSIFRDAFYARLRELKRECDHNMPVEIKMPLVHPLYRDLSIDCGEVDGTVFGSWLYVFGNSVPAEVGNDNFQGGYWSAAASWAGVWDQTTVDRVVLDQCSSGVDILWESRFEYCMALNDWLEVSRLLDLIPSRAVCNRRLSIRLDSACLSSAVGSGQEITMNENYTCSMEDQDAVCLTVPNIIISRFFSHNFASMWLKARVEQTLAKKFIFLKDHWDDTAEMVSLLARSGFMGTRQCTMTTLRDSSVSSSNFVHSIDGSMQADAVLAFHRLVVHFCAQYNLLNLLDLYLDYHKLAQDQDSLSLLQDAAGNNQSAMWLLLLRVKGKEYEASFCNARAVISRNVVPGGNICVTDTDGIVGSLDDMAEKVGELAALATLMYAPVRIEECLNADSMNNHGSSAKCTLEKLWPALQRFPTLGRSLRAACLGHDTSTYKFMPKRRVPGHSDLLDYLTWRETIFFSSDLDTSLLQMLPYWFPKSVRRLVQLYVQGPFGWLSLSDLSSKTLSQLSKYDHTTESEVQGTITALPWETIIQRHVEELYASSLKVNGPGIEHHLHRGRALAAFSFFLSSRVENWKMRNTQMQETESLVDIHQIVQADANALLGPITQSEESLLSGVVPLAITHFEDSLLVASCATLLELCGLSASIMQVDIAALRRISSFYRSGEYATRSNSLQMSFPLHVTLAEEGDIAESLARRLADYYVRRGYSYLMERRGRDHSPGKQPASVLLVLLHHLERACFPVYIDELTCGSWLATGKGDGFELRSQQKAASQIWNLVTTFCQIHQMPLSTKYLAALARDNDWVGFLSEAHLGGYRLETVIEIASKEFSNLPLKIHMLTVLKSMLTRGKVGSTSNSDTAGQQHETSIQDDNLNSSIELFEIIAKCEKLKYPGEVLLLKAKNLRWPLLAVIAACFPDISPLSCLAVWLEFTAARETSAIKCNDAASLVANNVGSAVEATNSLPVEARGLTCQYKREIPKRRRLLESTLEVDPSLAAANASTALQLGHVTAEKQVEETCKDLEVLRNSEEASETLSRVIVMLCKQNMFLPLLRAFEIFLPSCSILHFIRALQAFSQMRLLEASAHMGSFSAKIKEEISLACTDGGREGPPGKSLMSILAVKAADAVLSTCPSPYEKRCLLQLLAAADFGDGGTGATQYRKLYWKTNFSEPALQKDDGLQIGSTNVEDDFLLAELIKNASWEQARTFARELDACAGMGKSADYVTQMQAESLVSEWKEFLWDIPEERIALWGHCQSLFLRYSFPASQAGFFFLKHAEAHEKDLTAGEIHELLLLSLQWLSGMITQSNPVSPLNFLREIETKVWLLAVESESQLKSEGESWSSNFSQEPGSVKRSSIVDRTTTTISDMDKHINSRINTSNRSDLRENIQTHVKTPQVPRSDLSAIKRESSKTRRRSKGEFLSSRSLIGAVDKANESEYLVLPANLRDDLSITDKEENSKSEGSLPEAEEKQTDPETAILSLLEYGLLTPARQLQNKLSQGQVPGEFMVIDAAFKLAAMSTPYSKVSVSMLDEDVRFVIDAHDLLDEYNYIEPHEVLESLAAVITEGSGRALCQRIIAVVKGAKVLGLSFKEAFDKQPIELLQLLTLKAQDSFEEANLLVQTHSMPASSIAQVLAESFLKGLLAAHRGGYMDSQKEEGPSPLLWRFSDFFKWAELCPSKPEIGHALMRLVITGQEIPHACEVELLILAHHFYKTSTCLDGVDVLVALAGNRVEAYVAEGDFACLARLVMGVGNFHALKFIIDILIENGQLDLLLQKYSAAEYANTGTTEIVRGFRMAVLTSLQQFNPNDSDAFAMVYNHFDMKYEAAALLESRANESSHQWFLRYNKDQTDYLLESMGYFIEAAEAYSSIDAGNKTRKACAQASLMSLQIRMPDLQWLNLSETNARRVLVEQSRFQEALIVADAYGLNQPSEWALVLWNQMLKPELTEQFLSEFEAVLPLQPSMLLELARFYRAEVAARGDQSNFSVWLTGGGLPAEWAKYLGKSFRCLLRRTRDIGLRLRLATLATGFDDIVDACNRILDKVPENAGPLVLKKGHGGAYLPLM